MLTTEDDDDEHDDDNGGDNGDVRWRFEAGQVGVGLSRGAFDTAVRVHDDEASEPGCSGACAARWEARLGMATGKYVVDDNEADSVDGASCTFASLRRTCALVSNPRVLPPGTYIAHSQEQTRQDKRTHGERQVNLNTCQGHWKHKGNAVHEWPNGRLAW